MAESAENLGRNEFVPGKKYAYVYGDGKYLSDPLIFELSDEDGVWAVGVRRAAGKDDTGFLSSLRSASALGAIGRANKILQSRNITLPIDTSAWSQMRVLRKPHSDDPKEIGGIIDATRQGQHYWTRRQVQ